MPILYAIMRYLGFGGCIALGLLAYYEGIPGAYKIPFLSNVPVLGDLATGKVHSFAAEQVKIATSQQRAICDGKLEKLVSVAELAAVTAQRDRERVLRRMADDAAAEADKRAGEAEKAKATADAKVEQLLADADKDPGLTRPSEKDREWQRNH